MQSAYAVHVENLLFREVLFVRCDLTTMTQNDISSGRLILIVGVAPLKPAEFIFLKITIQT